MPVPDGELTSAGAYTPYFREQGRAIVAAEPHDENQRRFEADQERRKESLKAIQQIANGESEDWCSMPSKPRMPSDLGNGVERGQGHILRTPSQRDWG